jgi:transcriptional regulator with XRE-family HTH domain
LNVHIRERAKYTLFPQRLDALGLPMPRQLNHAVIAAWLLGISFSQLAAPAFAEPPAVEEVLGVLGMDKGQIAKLAQGRPVAYALSEDSADELAAGIAWYLPVPLAKVANQLRRENPDPLDVDIMAYGLLTERDGAASFSPVALSREEVEVLLDVEPGDEFNLSASEIESFKPLKQMAPKVGDEAVLQHYREILFQRFEAYRRGGTKAIAPYARGENRASKPSLELHQATNASVILARYFPALHKAWLDYPNPSPPGANETFLWVEKKVESRPAVILRHRISMDWNGGVLVLTREFYAPHSYNSSQWITGCLPYRNGTVIFQQVRSYTDQVAGIASNVKHIFGRRLLKDKMLKSFKRLCGALGQCP